MTTIFILSKIHLKMKMIQDELKEFLLNSKHTKEQKMVSSFQSLQID